MCRLSRPREAVSGLHSPFSAGATSRVRVHVRQVVRWMQCNKVRQHQTPQSLNYEDAGPLVCAGAVRVLCVRLCVRSHAREHSKQIVCPVCNNQHGVRSKCCVFMCVCVCVHLPYSRSERMSAMFCRNDSSRVDYSWLRELLEKRLRQIAQHHQQHACIKLKQ